ncbi:MULTISPECIES: hypothetical protein [unclassified Variovorax]|uniref:hypothetical protein n=1 Tax=unclassified Variovorax TaxID=663243 RepID=UPI0008389E31|nr:MULTISPECIES: hypothetical protein [unclassified Variovorax]PNG52297.1 hypothetical protein CHC07_04669 [Variovorax sp. B4]PNG54837.1 hypothetical protein CHC06_03635 [Variovorax sp. B2]VTV15847.1 hypothetical protein WDL1CHR_06209 [Variovorax sp. WDL1]
MTAYLRRDGNALDASSIQRDGKGGGFIVQPPGGVERVRVAASRPDIAVMLASGAVKPPPSLSAKCADAPARMTLTRTDINVIGDAVGAALTAKLKVRDERLDRLEDLARGATPAHQPARAAGASATGTRKLSSHALCLLATAAVASARATLASR